jgi:hypothetical protein
MPLDFDYLDLVARKHPLYRVIERSLARWMRFRHGQSFHEIESFCLFVGYPRSGHSLVGALLDAHPEAVISHELIAQQHVLSGCSRHELYGRILARAWWFHRRRHRGVYSYRVPGAWQGHWRQLRLIGDKRGGHLTRALSCYPQLLQQFRALTGVRLRLVHVVRNPWDNVAAISIHNRFSLEESVEFHRHLCAVTGPLVERLEGSELISLHHETLLEQPISELCRLAHFLDLPADPQWLQACTDVLFPRPSGTRHRVQWTPELIAAVGQTVNLWPFLRAYSYDDLPPEPVTSLEPARRR